MSSPIYHWKRFWCPRTGHVSLADQGYLDDPDSAWGQYSNPDVVSFETIERLPCLGLLGEPGMGKTRTMQVYRTVIDRQVEEKGGQTLWLDLRSYGSEDRLVRNLFESDAVIAWRRGGHSLHIFLDSLDECLLRIDTLATLLIDELQRHSDWLERLSLRVVCRTAVWPNTLEEGLRALWGNDAVEVYELVPLRRRDVIEAAKANGIEADGFLQEIDRKAVVPLAIKPVTLDFLLNIYRINGRFPSTQPELYHQGCQLLCEETNESRRDAGLTGTLTAEQRMSVAARIAATTIFANRYAVWTAPDLGNVPDEDVPIRQLYGGKETANGNDFEASEVAVREALDTGLFSSRGTHRMGWAHQSYAEFLAAHYLVQHHMPLAQIISLLVHPEDPEHKLVSQLHETASWLASMVPSVFRDIMRTDPDVLLRSDVATADVTDRAALVENLLQLYDEERLMAHDWNVRRQYSKLAHPGLADQLRPYIHDTSKGMVVRNVAIDIAETCKLQTLQIEFANLALDTSQPQSIRQNAAYAVSRIGDNAAKARLKLLATGGAGDDPDDELKGCGLRAVWPICLTAAELFTVITAPKRANFGGAYWRFLSEELVPHLHPSDLPVALKWVWNQPARNGLWHPFGKVIDGVILKSIENLDVPGVLRALARAVLSRLRHYDESCGYSNAPTYKGRLAHDDEKRHRLLRTMLSLLSDPDRDWVRLITSRIPLVVRDDVPWMIERLLASKSIQLRQLWVKLVKGACNWCEPGQFDVIYSASQKSPMLAEAFSWLFNPIALDSPEVQRMKTDYQEQQQWQERKKPLLQPPPAERIATLLEAFESGNFAAWWQLNMEMTLEPHSTYYGEEFEPDLTVLPGWKDAEPTTRARIVEAAKHYALEQDPHTSQWRGTNIWHRPAFAGYRALQLLLQEAPDFVATLPPKVWKKWAPSILAYPASNSDKNEETKEQLVTMAYRSAPQEIIDTLIPLIDKENKEHGRIFVTPEVDGCWDDRLADALLEKAKDRTLNPEAVGELLADLLVHQVDEAKTFAESLIPLPPPPTCDRRDRAVMAARALIAHANDAGWPVVWPALQLDTAFGREVILKLAQGPDRHSASVAENLTEEQVADLYLWLVQQFPHAEDPQHEGGWVGPRESIANWRDALLRHLKDRGTPKACQAVRRIMRDLPELNWLKWVLLEAENITRRRTWVPPQPGDILKLTSHSELRLVQSGDQLLEVLVESLKRLQAKLQGETPAAQFLWDKVIGKNAWRPKDENSFSDYVKIYLDEDLNQRGVIVNREVEIRRGAGPGQGERTDIHVDAVAHRPDGETFDSVTVIIEVKGCWHQELNHAMGTQLVDRYLKDNRCQQGLYLVGWFNCDQWDDGDYRKKQAPQLSIAEAQQRFNCQAENLSQEGLHIKAVVLNTALR